MQFAMNLGVDVVHFQNVMDFGTDFASKNSPIFDTDQEAVSFISSIQKPKKLRGVILPTIFRRNYSDFSRNECCHYPFDTAGVNSQGDINPCCYVNIREKYGNIFTEDDFWNNIFYQKARTDLLNGIVPFNLCHTFGVYGVRKVLK